MVLHAGVNAIGNYITIPEVALDILGSSSPLRGLVYWFIALVVVILTKGRLGADPINPNFKA
jgi:hypothetical protein